MSKKSLYYQEKKEIIQDIAVTIDKYYLFPEIAKKIKSSLLNNVERGIYDKINDYSTLASKLTQDLQTIAQESPLITKDNIHFFPNETIMLKFELSDEQPSLEIHFRDQFQPVKFLKDN
ncbi:MAG: hypothetical protein ACTSWY_07650 [Promethearchaeota archaeon]